MLGGLTIHPRVANFLQCICAKNYEKWLAVDKVIAKITRLTFFGPPCTVAMACVLCSKDVTLFFFDITCNLTHLSWSAVEEVFDSMSSEEFHRMLPLELSENDGCVPGTRASSSVRFFANTSSPVTK